MKTPIFRFFLALAGLFVVSNTCLQAGTVDEIIARKTLKVGVAAYAPWTFLNGNDDLEGSEIDIGRQIAIDLGVQVEYKLMTLPELYDAVEKDEIDLIAAGLAINPQRALKVDFSNPYAESGVTVLFNKKRKIRARTISEIEEGMYVVAVAKDTLSASLAPLFFDASEIRVYDTAKEADEALLSGRAHIYFTSVPHAGQLVASFPKMVEKPYDQPIMKSYSGFAVKRGNQSLLNYLNAWIVSHQADNWLKHTQEYWFGDFEWIGHQK